MNITQVVIRFPPASSKIKAFASIVLDDALVIHDFRIMESRHGLFISFPSRKASDNQYHDVIQVTSGELGEKIRNTILRTYQDEMARPENKFKPPAPKI